MVNPIERSASPFVSLFLSFSFFLPAPKATIHHSDRRHMKAQVTELACIYRKIRLHENAGGVEYQLTIDIPYRGAEALLSVYDGPSAYLTDNFAQVHTYPVLIPDGAQAIATLTVYDLAGNSAQVSYDVCSMAGYDLGSVRAWWTSARSRRRCSGSIMVPVVI